LHVGRHNKNTSSIHHSLLPRESEALT